MQRYQSIQKVSTFTGVMPTHKATGKTPSKSILTNERKYEPLMRYFEYLSNLGEVRATQVLAILVDGVQGRKNCNDAHNVAYLLTLMGYCTCYKGYMELLGYIVRSLATGTFIVEGKDGKAVNPGEYITYSSYFYRWKRDFPNMKESRPVKDVCPYCYVFANRHIYLENCGSGVITVTTNAMATAMA